ncbi:MAG: LysR family transcriptional regulator, partial [Candidatus Competibacteraceae bacterium]|nr:LysR family transcriptional regulator [Candidatus Competibacteraceae bacterium]
AGLLGRVAVGLPPSLTRILTVPLTKAFRSALPAATISISEGLSSVMQDALMNGNLDVALLYNATPSPEIDQSPLLEQTLHLVQPRHAELDTSPVTLRDIAQQALIIPSRPNAFRMQVETQLASAGLHPHIAIEVDTVSGLLDLVAEGMGCAILPSSTVQVSGHPDDFTIRPIIQPQLLAKLSMAVSSRRPTSQVQRHLMQLIETKVRDLIGPGP